MKKHTPLVGWVSPHIHIDTSEESDLVLRLLNFVDANMEVISKRYVRNPAFRKNMVMGRKIDNVEYGGKSYQWLHVRHGNIMTPKICRLIGFDESLPDLAVFTGGGKQAKHNVDFTRIFSLEFDVLLTGSKVKDLGEGQFEVEEFGDVVGCRIRIDDFNVIASKVAIRQLFDYIISYFKKLRAVRSLEKHIEIEMEISRLVGE